MLNAGEFAPDFTLQRDGGGRVHLASLRPQPVVIFFYPEDDTETCTLESIAFSSALPAFAAAGAQVFGLSKDPVASHERFCSKYRLQVPLLADVTGEVCEAYGVWAEKKLFGRTYMGMIRTTVLIDSSGKLARIWPRVRVKGHVAAVLAAVKAL